MGPGGTNVPLYNWSISSYAPNGDVLQMTDSVMGSWSYTYDDFNRLNTSVSTGGLGCAEVYDRYGNRLQQNAYNGTCAMSQFTLSGTTNRLLGLSYDQAGNVLNDGTHSYTYDAEERISTVDAGGTATYVYDAEGTRAQRVVNGVTYEDVHDLGGRVISDFIPSATPPWNRGEVYAGGMHLATYSGGTTAFIHADWLGTERIHSSVAGVAEYPWISYPFGEGSVTPDPGLTHFTGKERDAESGNDYFGARYYASSMGRFMSPDWSAKVAPVPYAKMDNPQSLNLYSYVLNNPMTGRDLDGHVCIFGIGNTCTPAPPPLPKPPDPAHVRPPNDHTVSATPPNSQPSPQLHGATVGAGIGLNAEVGDGKQGVAATANLNVALSMNDKQISSGLVDNHGAVATSGNGSAGTPQDGQPTIAGASGGVSATVFVSNAKSLFDLVGPFQTTTLNVGIASFQISTDGVTNVGSISVGSVGFSYTQMTTETTVGCVSGCN